ncbi:uncharacterized protein [Anabrus simplex]|uniref:uncharacterized protein n=1 Tax=Anabrus simplex TaxID=316456 RepID=UPI0035A28C9A
MEEQMHVICEHGQPHECQLEDERNEYNSMFQVWVKEEVLVKQEINGLEPEIKGKLSSYLEKVHTSSGQYKEGEIIEEHEPIPQACVKEEIKLEPHDPSQPADEQKLQSENMTNSSDECKRENENAQNKDEGENEEMEFQDVKPVCETAHEQELSASDVQSPLETMKMNYCCRQNMLLGKNCDICRKPTNIQKCLYKCQICDQRFAKKSEIQNHVVQLTTNHTGSYLATVLRDIFEQWNVEVGSGGN